MVAIVYPPVCGKKDSSLGSLTWRQLCATCTVQTLMAEPNTPMKLNAAIGARRLSARCGASEKHMTRRFPPKVTQYDQIILFDGVCKLCTRWSRFIIRFDKHHVFKLCSVQSDEGQAILKWFGFPTDYHETMLLVQGDKALTKSDSFVAVISQLPFPWGTIRVVRVIPKRVRDWLYDRLAFNRYAVFGRYDYCVLPTPDHNNRFL